MPDLSPKNISRRHFLFAASGRAQEAADKQLPILPWADSADVVSHCTGCLTCVQACPEEIIIAQGALVTVDFSKNGCSFCEACAEVCDEPVFAPVETRELSKPWHGLANISKACLTLTGVICQSCFDFCDQSAIRFSLNSSAIATPAILEDLCTGCGFCIASCPSSAISIDFDVSQTDHVTISAGVS